MLYLPAFASAHSHAFQRALRGRTQRAVPNGSDNFWTWRTAMYELAASLTPENLATIARVAFSELFAAGVRTLGEFHYVHHQLDGTPYESRTLMSEILIETACDVGLRICLLRTAYARANAYQAAEGVQRRFCDTDIDLILADVDTLRAKYKNNPNVCIGIAAHSVRAVPREWIRILAHEAFKRDLPFHMHVAEQPAEIESCIAETGLRPVELLAECDTLNSRFVAVHATHLRPHEAHLLGQAKAFACICPTTERDLGDGLPNLTNLRNEGVRICVGIDSHVVCDPLEEIRALETNERLRTQQRNTYFSEAETLAERLWREGSHEGAYACGFDRSDTEVEIDIHDSAFQFAAHSEALDALVFSAPSRVIRPMSSI